MDMCDYKEILEETGITIECEEKNTYKPLLRQLMICSAVWCLYFTQGLYLGAPTVVIAQLRREANSTDAVSDEMSSWISSMPAISAVPLVFVMTWLCYKIGRKFTYISLLLCVLITSIIFIASTNLYHLLISQAFAGPCAAAINTFTPILITEYTSPKYRGIFLTFKSASTFWGIWVSNAIGTFFYWKNIAIVGFLCSGYMVTAFAWPESPYWLAMKGRYAESAKSHWWLKGVNDDSKKELAKLIKKCKTISTSKKMDDTILFSCFSSAWTTITSSSFYKPALLCSILFIQYHFTGKFVISIYAIEVLKNITQDESVAYKGMLILDGVTVFSMYGGCVLSRYYGRRTLMFLFASTGILFLYILSFYLYLVSLSVVHENHIVIIFLLTVFSIAIGCGPMILASSIYGELVPSRYQSHIMILAGTSVIIVMSTLIKISPFMFKFFKMHGAFLFFAFFSSVIIMYLYFSLPETKDKSVHDIEEYFINSKNTAEQSQNLLKIKESK